MASAGLPGRVFFFSSSCVVGYLVVIVQVNLEGVRDWFVCCLRPYLPRSSKLIGLVVPANPIKENNFLIGPAQSEGELIAFWLHISIIKKWFPFRSIASNSVVKGFLVTKKKVGRGKKFPWRTYWAWWSNPVGNPAASRSSRLILHISRLLFTLADDCQLFFSLSLSFSLLDASGGFRDEEWCVGEGEDRLIQRTQIVTLF